MTRRRLVGLLLAFALLSASCEGAFEDASDGMSGDPTEQPVDSKTVRDPRGPTRPPVGSPPELPPPPGLVDVDGELTIGFASEMGATLWILDGATIDEPFLATLSGALPDDIEHVEWLIDGRLFRDDDNWAPYTIRWALTLPLGRHFDSDQGQPGAWRFDDDETHSVSARIVRDDGSEETLSASFSIDLDVPPTSVTSTTTTTTTAPSTVTSTTTTPITTTTTTTPSTVTSTTTMPPMMPPAPAGYGENLALINANTASRFSRFDNSSPYRDTPQADLDIADFVTGSTNIGSGKRGIWHTRCAVSHFAYDDPIVYPNEPGLSHLHMFFGNTDANAYSNNSSINNSGSSTCGRDELNRTSYWMPALLDGADTVVPADTITVYYAVRNDAVGSKVQAFPPGLRMIAGSASDPSLPEGIYWQCGYFGAAFEEQGNAGPEVSTIPNCSRNTYSHVAANIEFPRCWDGVNLDSADHRSHMSYGSGGSTDGSTTCPASHPVELPQIKYRLMFNLNASPTATNTWYLASDVNHDNGTVRANHGSSLHADWWSGWHPETNQILVEGCLRDNASECLSDDIGDGRTVNEGQMRRYRDAGINMNDVAALCPGQGPITNITQIATCRHH